MTDLETTKGCDAHKAVTACVRSIKQVQRERTEHIEEMHKDINSKVSTRLFLFAVGVLIAFMSFNAVQNIALSRDMAVMVEKMSSLSRSQEDIKQIMERYHP